MSESAGHQRREARRRAHLRRARRRRLFRAGLIVVPVVVLVTVAVAALAPDGGDDAEAGGRILPVRGTVESYRIVYEIEDLSGDDPVTTTDELLVQRPFASRLVTARGADPDDEDELTTTISDFGLFASRGSQSEPLVIEVGPSPAAGDVRLGPTLPALVEAGRLVPRGDRREVLGRTCQVYRTFEPVGTGLLAPPQEDEYADACIDADGLLLDEVWVVGGDTLRRKRAVEVEVDPDVPSDAFAPEKEPLAADLGGGALTELAPDALPPARYFEPRALPGGFAHRGRYSVTAPSGQRGPGGEAIPGATSFVDVWVDGPDIVVVEQGNLSGRDDEFDPARGGDVVEAGAAGEGRIAIGGSGTTLRVKTDAARFLRLFATVAPDEVRRIAGSIVAIPRPEPPAPAE